jgi:hypothetical protein
MHEMILCESKTSSYEYGMSCYLVTKQMVTKGKEQLEGLKEMNCNT